MIRSEPHDAPKLLVEWTPRWQGFVTSVGPALARSGPRLAGETPLGGTSRRSFAASLLLQAMFVLAVLMLPREIDKLRPYAAPRLRPYEVIYYSADELPRTEDLSGAQRGRNGAAGGQEAHHRTQTIRIARGGSVSEKVVDAPDLKLPSASQAVANLLAYKPNPEIPITPAPSLDGLNRSLIAPELSARIIAPAPAVNGESSRKGLTLTSIVPPAPEVSAQSARPVPGINSSIIPPAPSAPSEHALIAPRLDERIIGPAPKVSQRSAVRGPSLNAHVVAPPTTQISDDHFSDHHFSDDQSRSSPRLSAAVIPPAPSTSGPAVPATRVRMTNVEVVPPPVSAPERADTRAAKVYLPAPSVIAPPPTDSAHDLRRLESGAAANPTVVPPPPTQSLMSSIIGKIFGTQDVVPPPPSVNPGASTSSRALAANVVPPPPNVGNPRRNSGRTLAPEVVPPAPSASLGGISRPRASMTASAVVPPPPSGSYLASDSGRNGNSKNLSAEVVAPPPAVSDSLPQGRAASGRIESLSALAPSKPTSESKNSSGVVASAKPGPNVGLPGASAASLAMSPSGSNAGMGGTGGGSGLGNGGGAGSGLASEKPREYSGAAKNGTGRGFDASASNGISNTPGPGGAGSLAAGRPAVPGVDVQGGSTVVTLPSFGSDSNNPNLPRRSSMKTAQGPAITIVATSRSGGAFNFYGKLPGENYTVYVDTAMGTVVMQFAEANPPANSLVETIVGPEAIRADLPANLPHARMVVKCRLTASGNVTNLQVLEPGPAVMTAKIMAALPGWKFRPAMRGSQAVEINAILGFNIDTNDRY